MGKHLQLASFQRSLAVLYSLKRPTVQSDGVTVVFTAVPYDQTAMAAQLSKLGKFDNHEGFDTHDADRLVALFRKRARQIGWMVVFIKARYKVFAKT